MCRGWRRISIITTVLRPSDAKLSERIQSRVHAGGAIAMLTRMALFTLVTLMTACGTSGYADIPIEEKPTRATAAQQERYGVAEETLVLLELLPSSYKHDIGPAGGFHYRPYELVFDCEGPLQVQEDHEYRRLLRPQHQGHAERAECPSGRRAGGLRNEPSRGDEIWVSVVESENDDWGILVVAADAD